MADAEDGTSRPHRPPTKWKVLHSEYLHRRPWLTLRRDCVAVPNGTVIDEYYVFEYPAWVNVVAVTGDDRIVLVQQYRHGLGATHHELPGGVVDPGDADPLAAAKRELLEETGYGGGAWAPLLVSSANPGTHNNLTHSFLATGVARLGNPTPEPTEDLEVCVMPVGKVRALLRSGGMVQALHLAPLLTYFLSRAEAQPATSARR